MEWTRQRWVVVASLALAGQIASIFALHTRQRILAQPSGGELNHFPATTTNTASSEMEDLNDPLLFAGAHPHGFSAAVWLTAPKADYALSNSIPAPRYLDFERAPTKFGNENSGRPPEPPLPLLQFAVAKPAQKSVLWVEGALLERAPAKLPEAPPQFGSDVLSNTVVQVGVRADGFPLSMRVVTGSGSRGADDAALEMARKMRFAPLPINRQNEENPLQWGQMVVQWFTAEPASTNRATQAAVVTNAAKL